MKVQQCGANWWHCWPCSGSAHLRVGVDLILQPMVQPGHALRQPAALPLHPFIGGLRLTQHTLADVGRGWEERLDCGLAPLA